MYRGGQFFPAAHMSVLSFSVQLVKVEVFACS
jgi:hypothetical protein